LEPVPNQFDPAGLEPPGEPPSEDDEFYPGDFENYGPNIVQVVGSGFGTGLGKTNPSGRGFMQGWTEAEDILARESAWAAFTEYVAKNF
jgi:hypothetical protein